MLVAGRVGGGEGGLFDEPIPCCSLVAKSESDEMLTEQPEETHI